MMMMMFGIEMMPENFSRKFVEEFPASALVLINEIDVAKVTA